MKITTLAAAAAFSLVSTFAFAQATNAPGASTIGSEPNPNVRSPSSAGGSTAQTGAGSGGSTMQRDSGMTNGKSATPDTMAPDNSTQRR